MIVGFESRRVRKATRKIRSRWSESDYRRRSGAGERVPHTWDNVVLTCLQRIGGYVDQVGQEVAGRVAPVEFGYEAMEVNGEGKSVRADQAHRS